MHVHTPHRYTGRSPMHRWGVAPRGKHCAPPRWRRHDVIRAAGIWLLTGTAMVSVAALLLLALGPRTGAYRTVTMLTGSMRPTYPPGAVLIDLPQPTSQLRIGQVLTYQIPVDDHRVVSHRVVSVLRRDDGVDVRTKGDANNGVDPWVAHVSAPHVWVVHAVVPGAGRALLWLRSPGFHQVLLYWLPGVALCWLLVGLWRPDRGDAPA